MNGLYAGVVLGLSIAAPIGPMGILCIERALAGGFSSGLAAGLGAATVHAAYSCLIPLALARIGPQVDDFAGHGQAMVRLFAVALLLWIGGRTLTRSLAPSTRPPVPVAMAGCYSAAVALTLANPVTVSFFAVLTPLMAAGASPTGLDMAQLPLGVFLGSSLWWMVLSGSIGLARSRVTDHAIRRINRACGLLIVSMALVLALDPPPGPTSDLLPSELYTVVRFSD
ncbi:LysE family translocator [Azospirillum brasilense]|uniref:LysE family translocator n=1 Tax=Azospirillum brasilense TaxID=192 RepID=A0A235HF23_AZOBR|nr:LysE family transporter [Azospirillum brasilense]OYD83795.1 hypothetical protein CHT98_13480 [Azospirillum brasilense]